MRFLPGLRGLMFASMALLLMLSMPARSAAQLAVGVTVAFAPPDLPVYEQPLCPGEGYIWTPGFWAWDADFDDYYWVPGTWVLAPEVGFLWTPGYWGWGGSGFVFYQGYWSYQTVGFYGGIDYGYGYFGNGYEGGRWQDGRFYYNRAVNNVNVTVVHNVYNTTVVNQRNVTRVSYNGGNGGVNARPTPQQEAAAHARHLPPAPPQRQHIQEARSNPQLRASVNRGKPPIAATPTPTAFSGRGVVPAREGGAIHGGPRNSGNAGRNIPSPENNNSRRPVHARDLPPIERPAPPNTGNPKQDSKYQKQQEKIYAQQEKDRQKLQRQQDKEDQRIARQNVDQTRREQVEQRHQQQTEQLQQRHSQQQQRMQEREQPRSAPPPPKPKH